MEDRQNSPISRVAKMTGFTRSHVRNIFARHRRRLKLRLIRGRWLATPDQIHEMARTVRRESGRRYKLGETGPRG